jgi:transcriptional regulator with XRE-family HTH domain
MKDRIILLIKAKNLTAAQFADEIGVQKSSISHILSGRNNASLDFIQKILLRYPEVNMEWLMFGKGPLFKGAIIAENPNNDEALHTLVPSVSPPVDLFSALLPTMGTDFRKETDLSAEPRPAEIITRQVDTQKTPSFPTEEKKGLVSDHSELIPESEAVSPEKKLAPTKSILKIVEFYSDNTFREFFPEQI